MRRALKRRRCMVCSPHSTLRQPTFAVKSPSSPQVMTRSRLAAKIIGEAQNLIVMFGDERTTNDVALAQACANFVVATDHIGKANNGLLSLWAHANTQGVYDMLTATGATGGDVAESKVLYVVAADPIGDGAALPAALPKLTSRSCKNCS